MPNGQGQFDPDSSYQRAQAAPVVFDPNSPYSAVTTESAPAATEKPGFLARTSEALGLTQHPIKEVESEAGALYHHPINTLEEAGKNALSMITGIPRNADWSLRGAVAPGAFKNSMASVGGIPGMFLHPIRSTGGDVFAEDLQDRNYRGALGDVVGATIPFVIGSIGSPEARGMAADVARGAAERIGDVRGGVGEAIRTPEGKLKMAPRALARVGGAAAGYATHIPEGGLVGALAGPSLLESIFPDPNAEMRARGAFMNRGYRPTPFVGAEPRALPAAPDDVSYFPEPRNEFEGETPNYMASVPRDELSEMAARGKPGAGRQLQQLGKPVLYLPRGARLPEQ